MAAKSGPVYPSGIALLLFVLFIRSALGQDFCTSVVSENRLTVDDDTLSELRDAGASLQDAVDCLESGGRVVFLRGYSPERRIRLDRNLTLTSTLPQSPRLTCGDGPLFVIGEGASVEMSNLEVRGCDLSDSADAAVVVNRDSRLTLTGARFERNRNSDGWTAIFVKSGAGLTMEDSRFEENRGRGGAVRVQDPGSKIVVSNTSFVRNQANGDGGGALHVTARSGAVVRLTNGSLFDRNSARDANGGAVYCADDVSLIVETDTRFLDNQSGQRGGGIFVSANATLSVSDAFFVRNEANFTGGGGIYAENSTADGELVVDISNTVFSENLARNYLGGGGGLRVEGNVNCTLREFVSFVLNTADLDGAGMYIASGKQVEIDDASFVGNEALNGGGAALFAVSLQRTRFVTMQITVRNSSFLFNRGLYSDRGGGNIGLAGFGSTIDIEDCYFGDNDSGRGAGGAVYLFSGPVATIRGSTFERNKGEWGGALYAENDARYELVGCDFFNNTARQGGAVHTRGDVDLEIKRCEFRENAAITEGGAILANNYKSSGDELAKFNMENTTMNDNEAGSNMFEDRLYGTLTTGGAVLARGSGIDLHLTGNKFKGNRASEGGAVSMDTVADCVIENNTFERNEANFGGGIFWAIDELIQPPNRDTFEVEYSNFTENSAVDGGGGLYVVNTRAATDSFNLNAHAFRVTLRGVRYSNNSASYGGGVVVLGTGIKIRGNSTFTKNNGRREAITANEVKIAQGGALAIQTGAAVDCEDAVFEENAASVGGAVFIQDASLKASGVNFIENRVEPTRVDGDSGAVNRDSGAVGGAIAIETSRGRDITVLNSANRIRNSVLDCGNCVFRNNDGHARGGALHIQDMDPNDSYALNTDCTPENLNTSRTGPNQLTCPTYERYRVRLEGRVVRLSKTKFIENTAKEAGGAIFTNNIDMMLVAENLVEDEGTSILTQTAFEAANITFRDNDVGPSGYGKHNATTPQSATLTNTREPNPFRVQGEPSANMSITQFLSGASLAFDVSFTDAFGQTVRGNLSLSARIEHEEGDRLDISGQATATFTRERLAFTEVVLKGIPEREYVLKVVFESQDAFAPIYLPDSKIYLTMRDCQVGEHKIVDENDLVECRKCAAGFFTSKPAMGCTRCSELQNEVCYGDVVVPDDGYWHATSHSLNVTQCIGHESCIYRGRHEEVRVKAKKEHESGMMLDYTVLSDHANVQCRGGYTGLLCGECRSGYGRESNQCRKCASRAVRGVVLTLLLLWLFAFLSYFIRSVLQLATRIEFNKRFKRGQSGTRGRFVETATPQTEPRPAEREVEMQKVHSPQINGGGGLVQHFRRLVETRHGPATERKPPEPSRRDLARVAANRIHMERLRSLRPENGPNEPESSTDAATQRDQIRGKGRLATKLRALIEGSGDEDIEPLLLANPVSEILKILVNFLQVTAVALSIHVNWQTALRTTIIGLNMVGNVSSGEGFLSFDCFMEEGSTRKSLRRMTFTLIAPILVFLVYVTLWGMYTLIKKHSRDYLAQRVLLTFLAINYFVYTGMTRNLMRFFACVRIRDDVLEDLDNRHVWEEDSDVECFEGKHALLVGLLVVPLLLVVTLGFPLGVFIILLRNKDRLNDEEFVATYGFLYRAYDLHYWEVVIMLRKASVAMVAVFAYRLGANLQGLMCVLVMVVALCLHLVAQPFTQEIPQLNYLETISLSTTITVFVAGLMMNDDMAEDHDSARVLLSVVAIFTVGAAVFWMLAELVFATEEVIDMKLIELGAMDIDRVLCARLSQKSTALFYHYSKIVRDAVGTFFRIIHDKVKRPRSSRTAPEPVFIFYGRIWGLIMYALLSGELYGRMEDSMSG